MKKTTQKSSSKSTALPLSIFEVQKSSDGGLRARRSSYEWLMAFGMMIFSSWAVYHYQFQDLPSPVTVEQAGETGFSEVEALKHVKALTELGPHSVGSDALDVALEYVLAQAEDIKKNTPEDVNVEVDFFHAKTGANGQLTGNFLGKTLTYSDLKHVLIRILPKNNASGLASEEVEDSILVSAHVDTVFAGPGAGDDTSNVAVMLELARAVSHQAGGFKNGIIFFFNTGEEEGLHGSHSFITQHPWSNTVTVAVDLEAMGLGGKSGLFQTGPDPWAIENFASAAKYPSGNVISQDLFSAGVLNSATDFQVYKEIGGLSGLDFAYTDKTAVYHTKNDKLQLLKSGSLQHLGENMLAFLLQGSSSSDFPTYKALKQKEKADNDAVIFFDILGTYMVLYSQSVASMINNMVIMISLAIWGKSLMMGGYSSVVSLALSCLGTILSLVISNVFSAAVAFILPQISSSAVPYIASPWLAIGLFAAPALLGAILGQNLGYRFLLIYLESVYSNRKELSSVIQDDLVKLEAEKWLFKAGSVPWLVLLIAGQYFQVGSSYLAILWLVPPMLAYLLLDSTLTSSSSPKSLKLSTSLIGLAVPILVSAGTFIQLTGTLIGNSARLDKNPGSNPEWMANVILGLVVAVVISLTFVYILSSVHLSGAIRSIVLVASVLFGLSLALVYTEVVPPFTEETSRAIDIVHVVDSTGTYGTNQVPVSYVSLFSVTPGKLTKEAEEIGEGFTCGTSKVVDFVTFPVTYGCWSYDDTNSGWSASDIPKLRISNDTFEDERITQVRVDTKTSTRWALSINMEEIEDFSLADGSGEIIPFGNKTSVDGWHIVQFAGGKESPTEFELTLQWGKNGMQSSQNVDKIMGDERSLLKLRTDIEIVTPKVGAVLTKIPAWTSLFGKSTNPHTFSFLTDLPVNFEAVRM